MLRRWVAAVTAGRASPIARPRGATGGRDTTPQAKKLCQLYFILYGVIDRPQLPCATQDTLAAYLTTLRHHHTLHGPPACQASLSRCPSRLPDPWCLTLRSRVNEKIKSPHSQCSALCALHILHPLASTFILTSCLQLLMSTTTTQAG